MKDILPVIVGMVFFALFGLVLNQLFRDFEALSQLRHVPEVELDERLLNEHGFGELIQSQNFRHTPEKEK